MGENREYGTIRLRPVAPEVIRLAEDARVPNNPRLPVLVYGGVLDAAADDLAGSFAALFAGNGWGGIWYDGIFRFPHYHSTAHEALGIARGRARLRLGGASGIEREVAAGDALVLPAGTGHENLGSSPDLLVVGAYPPGQRWDLLRGGADARVRARIARVPRPATDPLFGREGPLPRLWSRCPIGGDR